MTDWLTSLQTTLAEHLGAHRYDAARTLLLGCNPVDIATLLEALPPEQALPAFRLLPKTAAAQAFSYMPPDTQERLLRTFTDGESASLLHELDRDDAADLLEELPAGVVKRLLRLVPPEDRRQLNELLQYPEHSAGSLLTTELVDLKASMTVAAAIRYIRACGPDNDTIYTCYVTDADRRLEGVLTVRQLLLAHETQRVGELMDPRVLSAHTTDDQEDVAKLFAKYDLMALPVVDSEERLVGIITVDDVVDILQKEATEEFEKMAAITPTDKPYFKTGVWATFAGRIPWLMLLMVSATFTGMIITSFEAALAASVALTAFIPMLMDTGGNSGSQASVTITRGLALGDIRPRDVWRVLWKEGRVALLCGLALAAAAAAKILLVDRWLLGSAITGPEMLVVCVTLAATVVCAKLVGCSLPLLASRLGLDPAVMASPFITTIVDALSLLMYFFIAQEIIHP